MLACCLHIFIPARINVLGQSTIEKIACLLYLGGVLLERRCAFGDDAGQRPWAHEFEVLETKGGGKLSQLFLVSKCVGVRDL